MQINVGCKLSSDDWVVILGKENMQITLEYANYLRTTTQVIMRQAMVRRKATIEAEMMTASVKGRKRKGEKRRRKDGEKEEKRRGKIENEF